MKKVGLFSAESNSHRILSMFRTILNRKLNHDEIMDAAMLKLNVKRGTRKPMLSSASNDDPNFLELQRDLGKLPPRKQLKVDEIVSNSKIKSPIYKNVQYQSLLRFQKSQIETPEVKKDEPEVAAANITESGNPSSIDDIQGWMDDKALRNFEAKAQEQLNYDPNDIRSYVCESEDPILQAHSHISTKNRKSIIDVKLAPKIPMRYLKNRNGRTILFNFNHLFSQESHEETKPVSGSKDVRIVASKIPQMLLKNRIIDTEILEINPAEFGFKGDISMSSTDLLDANLARFKEVEELYNEIMKSVDETKLENDDDVEVVYACPAAPADQLLSEVVSTNHTLAIRKPIKQVKPVATSAGKNGSRNSQYQILKKVQKSFISADAFRKNRKNAMKKIISSKYHFKYNYGGYFPADSLKKNAKAKIVNNDDYDDYLADKFCDFVPMLIFQEKRDAESSQAVEEEEEEDLMQLKEMEEKERAELARQERIKQIFTPKRDLWNPEVLDYIEETGPKLETQVILCNKESPLQKSLINCGLRFKCQSIKN